MLISKSAEVTSLFAIPHILETSYDFEWNILTAASSNSSVISYSRKLTELYGKICGLPINYGLEELLASPELLGVTPPFWKFLVYE